MRVVGVYTLFFLFGFVGFYRVLGWGIHLFHRDLGVQRTTSRVF